MLRAYSCVSPETNYFDEIILTKEFNKRRITISENVSVCILSVKSYTQAETFKLKQLNFNDLKVYKVDFTLLKIF